MMIPSASPTRQTDHQRLERLYDAVDQYEWGCELPKRVYHLGIPRFNNSVPTASLTFSGKGRPVFQFGRRFFDRLGHVELVFVILHEALHFAFCHHLRRQDRLPAIWNVACDLVVNEFLLRRVGFGSISTRGFKKFIKSAITFENLPVPLTADPLELTAEEVYDVLYKEQRHMLAVPSGLTTCDEHEWSQTEDGYHGTDPEQIEDFVEQIQRDFRECVPDWGDRSSGELRAIGEVLKPISLRWDLILSNRLASCVRLAFEQRWAPPNRKIAWLYPDVLLPADREVEKARSSVLLAIDASGSISGPVLDRLLSIARSIPKDRVELTTVSFDRAVFPVDIWAREPEILGGGGTSFDAIEHFAIQLRRYPDLIVVLTDGHAPHPTVLHPHRWFWIITQGGTSLHVEGIGRCCQIEDLMINGPECRGIDTVAARDPSNGDRGR